MSLFLLFAIGCSSSSIRHLQEDAWQRNQERIDMLRRDLLSLGRDLDQKEAQKAAETAILYSQRLAEEYRAVRPPVIHNILVNLGIKERGLCVHWTEDLLKQLKTLGLRQFDLYWAIANRDSLLLPEHSSVVITPRGAAFEDGLVLDAWRHSGELYWIRVKEDTYPWVSRTDMERSADGIPGSARIM